MSSKLQYCMPKGWYSAGEGHMSGTEFDVFGWATWDPWNIRF